MNGGSEQATLTQATLPPPFPILAALDPHLPQVAIVRALNHARPPRASPAFPRSSPMFFSCPLCLHDLSADPALHENLRDGVRSFCVNCPCGFASVRMDGPIGLQVEIFWSGRVDGPPTATFLSASLRTGRVRLWTSDRAAFPLLQFRPYHDPNKLQRAVVPRRLVPRIWATVYGLAVSQDVMSS